MKIVFMGTPDFAVPALRYLARSHHDVLAVVTAPDKIRGRGLKAAAPEVKICAHELGLPVYQPTSLKSGDFQESMKRLAPDIFVVVAFRILPAPLFAIPRFGAVNAHGSLLPKYRGAAPIHWAVYHGEKETGITTFKIDRSVDTGGILLQRSLPILDKDTTGTLYDTMKILAAELLVETLDGLEDGSLQARPQNNETATPAPKIFPEMGELDFSRRAVDLVNHIRAFNPFPGCYFMLGDHKVKIFEAEALPSPDAAAPGQLIMADKKSFAIGCGEGLLKPLQLQLPGRKAMDTAAFMNGFRLQEYIR